MRTHLDLFSGIGGFALAARWNNIQTIGFCEIEDYPRRVLERHFPDVRIHRDIRDLDGSGYKGVSLITAGIPCQPFSRAGKQRGQEDDRWLWSEMLRVVIEAQPTYLIIENVAGFIDLALDTVCADLEAEDYATGTVVLGAASVNAPHRRQRIWCLAKRLGVAQNHGFSAKPHHGRTHKTESGTTQGAGPDVAHPSSNGLQGCRIRDKGSEHSEEVGQGTAESIGAGAGSSSRDVAHSQCQSVRDQRCSGNAGPEGKGEEQGKKRQRVWTDVSDEGGNGSADRSIFKSHLGGRTDGLSAGLDMPRRWGDGTWEEGIPRVTTEKKNRTARLKALGNAILPQVAYEIIRCMKEIDESE